MTIRLQPIDYSLDGWIGTTKQQLDDVAGVGQDTKTLLTPLQTLTTETLHGTGVFDALMRATKLHLSEEYNSQRITGTEYATVYLGALSVVLQTSVQFLLNQQQANQIAAEIGLIRQKTVTELANTDDNIPIGLGFNHIPAVPTAIPIVTVPEVVPT